MTERATPRVQVDNDRVRITEWTFAPGTATGPHVHEFDYVVVPMTTGTLLIRTEAGESPAALTAGEAYAREAGVSHDVINANEFEFRFIEVEIR